MTPSVPQPLDVRTIPPAIRHAAIFQLIERLAPGEMLAIVSGHDPIPLRLQIEARHGGAFSWSYVVAGPDFWQVEIARRAARRPALDAAGCGDEDGEPCTCGS